MPWFISMEPGMCFCLTKSAQKNVKVLGGQCTLCIPDSSVSQMGIVYVWVAALVFLWVGRWMMMRLWGWIDRK